MDVEIKELGFLGTAGGGREALNLGRRFLAPPAAAFRKLRALLWIPGEAAPDTDALDAGTGVRK